MNVQRSPSRAVAWMVAAVACFSLMDAGMKQLSASYPTLEVTFLRGAASLPFVLVWVLVSAGPRSLVPRRWGLHLLRGALGMAMIGCFVFALRDLPLSTAYTIYFVAPLLIAALSVPLLGERVGPRRWVAIGIGLVGVLVVLRPGVDGFISVPGLLAIPGWVPLQLAHAPLIAGMGLAGALGQIALTKAFQLGEASMIAPLEYSGLVWVIGWDLAFWGQLPDGYTWVGAAIIVASGLYLLHRERVNRQEPPKPLDHP